eukprot:scaffold81783_cov74-Phaeocystis_antarctica.AAC.1
MGLQTVAVRVAALPFAFDQAEELLTLNLTLPAEETLTHPGCTLRTFDKVRVRISVDATKAHRPKLKLRITEPVLPTA